ncbi:MAG: hypothetical protein IJ163_03145 [Bacteroidaceae bacterium]|nr:hypothetical protein [Bacteroidaceae bacterium]
MEKNNKQPEGYSEVIDFIENTKEGKFTEESVTIEELLKCSISHEDVDYIQNENIQTSEIFLYGLH